MCAFVVSPVTGTYTGATADPVSLSAVFSCSKFDGRCVFSPIYGKLIFIWLKNGTRIGNTCFATGGSKAKLVVSIRDACTGAIVAVEIAFGGHGEALHVRVHPKEYTAVRAGQPLVSFSSRVHVSVVLEPEFRLRIKPNSRVFARKTRIAAGPTKQ